MKTICWRFSSELRAAVALLSLIALLISANDAIADGLTDLEDDPSYQTKLPRDGSSSSGESCALGAAGCSGSGFQGGGHRGSAGGSTGGPADGRISGPENRRAEAPSQRPVRDRIEEPRTSRARSPEGSLTLAPAIGRLLPVVIFVLGLAFLIYLLVTQLQARPAVGRTERIPEDELASGAGAGQDLGPLSEVDTLAAAGRYGEAIHLLWLHAVPAIGHRLNRAIEPSWTSREVLRRSGAPAEDRRTLEPVVRAVELFFFGGRALDRSDYESCRRHLDVYLRGGTP